MHLPAYACITRHKQMWGATAEHIWCSIQLRCCDEACQCVAPEF